jgi:hypothetical protein
MLLDDHRHLVLPRMLALVAGTRANLYSRQHVSGNHVHQESTPIKGSSVVHRFPQSTPRHSFMLHTHPSHIQAITHHTGVYPAGTSAELLSLALKSDHQPSATGRVSMFAQPDTLHMDGPQTVVCASGQQSCSLHLFPGLQLQQPPSCCDCEASLEGSCHRVPWQLVNSLVGWVPCALQGDVPVQQPTAERSRLPIAPKNIVQGVFDALQHATQEHRNVRVCSEAGSSCYAHLPGAQVEAACCDGDGEGGAHHAGFAVGRHVVIPLVCVHPGRLGALHTVQPAMTHTGQHCRGSGLRLPRAAVVAAAAAAAASCCCTAVCVHLIETAVCLEATSAAHKSLLDVNRGGLDIIMIWYCSSAAASSRPSSGPVTLLRCFTCSPVPAPAHSAAPAPMLGA